ncbi:MAG: ribonuclease HII [Nitrososphaeraceae archaeon]|nr:ribonuclease HII [Nitrososphaeraceae archaeon]MDW0170464.1 ribonuclease HII [Nitrososphaeraceae archaeon]MDW0199115.1 ribonuclease HII [Nitrososphaeraceae archaeon]MDW0214125.1 ribonuclease HII [Nitrososphaeraceae archaeon]MDW0224203.1 ribonuclease HII [Nitrososphaeraceae archaeon]
MELEFTENKNSICGVDEAGRGSLIGPIIVAGISVSKKSLSEMVEIGIKDSKLLTPKKRQILFGDVIGLAESICICRIGIEDIDFHVSKNHLNLLEAEAMAITIGNMDSYKTYVDSCDVNPSRYKRTINSFLKRNNTKLISMHHADRLNVVVSGASIIAKVIRDSEISKIRLKYGDLGSGYPSDKKTIKFVQEWFEQNREIPPFARKSWKPAQLILSRTVMQ